MQNSKLTYETVLQEYKIGVKALNQKELLPYFEVLHDLIFNNTIDKISLIINTMSIKNSSTLILVSIMRLSFTKSNTIENYQHILNKISLELDNRNENGKQILQGLFK